MEPDFPSNSKHPRPPEKDSKADAKVEKVVTGKVVRRKKPLGKRVKDLFISGDDAKSVLSHVVNDRIGPAVQDMIVDAGYEALQRVVLGESRPRRGPGGRAGAMISPFGIARYNAPTTRYDRYSGGAASPAEPRPTMTQRGRATHDFDELVFETRVEADEVIDRLFDLVSQYGRAKVSDFYDLAGVTGSFQDERWGWTNLQGTDATRVSSGGYVVNLPRPEPL